MRSIDIDSGNSTAHSSRLAGLGRKLCGCCSTKSSKANPVQLTKAEAITNQPTSSNISVAGKDVFSENLTDDNFHSVELQVPRESDDDWRHANSGSRPNRSADLKLKEDTSLITNAVLDRIINESDEVDREASEKTEEEVSPDIDLADVVEEASDSDVHGKSEQSVNDNNRSERSAENQNADDDPSRAARTSSPKASEKESNGDHQSTLLPETLERSRNSPIEENTPEIAIQTRTPELNDKQQSPAWSPVKPPRRASQLLAKEIPLNPESVSSGAPVNQTTRKICDSQEESADLASGSDEDDRTTSEIPYVQFKSKPTDGACDDGPADEARTEPAANAWDADEESDGEESRNSSREAREQRFVHKAVKTALPDESSRVFQNSYEETRQPDDKTASRMYASCSSSSEESAGEENVTRVSVKSNGEATVSAVTFDGEFIKVRLGSATDNADALTDEEFNERLI